MMRVLTSCILVLFAGCIANGQLSEGHLAFEVASIKPSDPAQTIAIRRSGYRLSTSNTSLQKLLTWAYEVHSDRLYGKPAWLDAVQYDIVANEPREGLALRRDSGQFSRLQQMMQGLLAERFKLVIHREIRELRMYALVVARSGTKVRLTEPSDSIGQDPFSMPGRGRLNGTKVSTEMLAKALSDQLSTSVQDQTALKGVFDFTLEWEPDTQLNSADDIPTPFGRIRTGSSLFSAIQEQLGFRLEPRKGRVEVFVIDHIERTPTEN